MTQNRMYLAGQQETSQSSCNNDVDTPFPSPLSFLKLLSIVGKVASTEKPLLTFRDGDTTYLCYSHSHISTRYSSLLARPVKERNSCGSDTEYDPTTTRMLGKRSLSALSSMSSTTTSSSSSTDDHKHSATSTISPAQDHHKKQKRSLSSSEDDQIIRKEVNLPDPKQDIDLNAFLSQVVQAQCGFTPRPKSGLDLGNFFPQVTEEQIAAYDMKLVTACRENDVDSVKTLCNDEGHSAECCNRFGESLLHMACRRGFVDIVQFLLEEASLGVTQIDDCGRTPLHDACWNPSPQLEIVTWLIERDPSLLFIKDKRGSTPFDYARPQDWPTWRQFLVDNASCLESLDKDIFS